MIGFFKKKYYVAICVEDITFINKIVTYLMDMYSGKLIIQSYTDSRSMFEAVNINKSKNKPFDLVVCGQNKMAEKMVLKRTSPSLPVILYNDEKTLKSETSKIFI